MYWSRSVSADRKAKMKKQEERDRRQRAKWVETYERILPLVGAKDLFQRLPEPTREGIRRLRFPSPEICFGDDFNRVQSVCLQRADFPNSLPLKVLRRVLSRAYSA